MIKTKLELKTELEKVLGRTARTIKDKDVVLLVVEILREFTKYPSEKGFLQEVIIEARD